MNDQDKNLDPKLAFKLAGEKIKNEEFGDAERILKNLLIRFPDRESLLINLSAVYARTQNLEALKGIVVRGRTLYPRSIELAINAGEYYKLKGEIDEAREIYQDFLEFDPKQVDVLSKLVELELDCGHYKRAAKLLDEAGHLSECCHHLRFVKARLHLKRSEYKIALAIFEQFIADKIFYREAKNNAALCRQGMLDYDGAEAYLSDLIGNAVSNEIAAPLINRAFLRLEMADQKGFKEDLYKLRHMTPEDELVLWGEVVAGIVPVYDSADAQEDSMRELDAAIISSSRERERDQKFSSRCVLMKNLFYLAYVDQNHKDRVRNLFAQIRGAAESVDIRSKSENRPRRCETRVGIISSHIRRHSVSDAITMPLLLALARTTAKIYLYNIGGLEDDVTEVYKHMSHKYISGNFELDFWLHELEADNLDIAFYPEIGMESKVIEIALHRVAPNTYVSWGHPHTTGMKNVDYFVSGHLLEPDVAQSHYTEELITLPGLGTMPQRLRSSLNESRKIRPKIFLERFLAICPGTPYKYNPKFDWIFIEISRKWRDTQLVFFESDVHSHNRAFQHRLSKLFESASLNLQDHACFLPWQTPSEFHWLLSRAQVMLDTIEFSGFNTVQRALECELPVLTLRGQFMRGRFGSALLEAIGLQSFIAKSPVEYLQIFENIRREPDLLQQARLIIRKNLCVIFDGPNPWDAFVKGDLGLSIK